MKAVGYRHALPIVHADSLVDIEIAEPVMGPHDLLVEVRAVAVNPVDTKIRSKVSPEAGHWKVLGWDAAGIVRATGSSVSLFKPGDRVWYAGAIGRQGNNSELHVVDERITGRMPQSVDFDAAAAMPLTAITAWEMLFTRLQVERAGKKTILIVGAAGGVGSIMTQLARQLTDLHIVATASRPETREWVESLGAHRVIDHGKPLVEEYRRLGLAAPDYVVSLTQTDQHYAAIADLIAPQGRFGLIDDPTPSAIDIGLLKRKSVSLHWELMFTRSIFGTADLIEQHALLNEVADLVDAGTLRSTATERFGPINASNLKRAHAFIESGAARGKIVLQGF